MVLDGVFLNLPFDTYIAERDTLGSTDKSKLWLRGRGWWWASRLNPFWHPTERGEELLFGECAHAALLEGLHAFESRYIVAPSKRDHPDALYTVPQIKEALKNAGVYPAKSSTFTKEDWAEVAEAYLPDQPVWENVLADFHRRLGGGRSAITAETDFAIRAMRDIALTEGDEEMRELLSVGSKFPVLAEVSYFYTDEMGLRHRCRFDKLLPTSVVDLKTLGNWQGDDLAYSVDRHVKRMGYDVQIADYQVARRHMMAKIREDESCIHGGTEEEREHLIAMAHYDEEHPKPSWGWIFYQKPSLSGNAPILFPVIERWAGPYHRAGHRKRHVALQTYHDSMAKFGPDKPWGQVEKAHITEDRGDEIPHIWIGDRDWGPGAPVDGELEFLDG